MATEPMTPEELDELERLADSFEPFPVIKRKTLLALIAAARLVPALREAFARIQEGGWHRPDCGLRDGFGECSCGLTEARALVYGTQR